MYYFFSCVANKTEAIIKNLHHVTFLLPQHEKVLRSAGSTIVILKRDFYDALWVIRISSKDPGKLHLQFCVGVFLSPTGILLSHLVYLELSPFHSSFLQYNKVQNDSALQKYTKLDLPVRAPG